MHRILLSFERLESFLPFAFQLLGVYGPMAWSVGRSPVGFPSHVLAFSRWWLACGGAFRRTTTRQP